MNKKHAVGLTVTILLIFAGYLLLQQINNNDELAPVSPTITSQPESANPTIQTSPEENPKDTKQTESSRYITLSDYEKSQSEYENSTKVYFFHAPWCPICRNIDQSLNENPAQIPEDVVLIKTDFDSETALKQKYGVTTQYTFVQVDNEGNEVAQWTANSAEKAVNGIQM